MSNVGVLVVRIGQDQYLRWSNTVDAPVTCVMGREEIRRNLEEHNVPYAQAVRLLDLVDQSGTSDPGVDLTTLLDENRAGPDEEWLSKDEILRAYRAPD